MNSANKKVKYPENLALKEQVIASGKSVSFLAKKLGVSRCVLSMLINGHYKGVRIAKLLSEELSK